MAGSSLQTYSNREKDSENMYRNYEYSTQKRRIQEYILQMRPVFSKDALFSDSTENYRMPMEAEPGENVTIRFRTMKNNVDEVYLAVGEQRIPMYVEASFGGFDYYETKLTVGEKPIEYFFEIAAGQIRCYYYRNGAFPEKR